tara:strand:+ start:113090 stop:114247 length:1158 start_codon:yes stop_codon:yes gene_type:complete
MSFDAGKFICPINATEYKAEDFQEMFRHAYRIGKFSDIYIRIGYPVIVRSDSMNYKLSPKEKLSNVDVKNFISDSYNDGVYSDVLSGGEFEDSYSFYVDPDNKRNSEIVRMRLKVVRERGKDNPRGVAVVLRLIDNKIPTFDDLRVRELIRENIFPRQGLVIVAGETGSGKSTLLASVIHKILTDTSDDTPDAVLMELSDPIEFVYDSLSMGRNMIVQCAVGKRHDTKSFAQGIKNAKRMNTTHILIGESRDIETVEQVVDAANIGNACYTTFHANKVSGVIKGLAQKFGTDGERAAALDIVRVLQMVVVQYLAKVPGGRIPVQEILVFNESIRATIEDAPENKFYSTIDDCVERHGVSMSADARRLLDEKLIDDRTYRLIMAGL